MPKHYHEVACLRCGDLYLTEWTGPRNLCRLCDENGEEKFRLLAEAEEQRLAEGYRQAGDLAKSVDAERRMPWQKKRFRSMWEGHQE